jgi:hypothetical protein
VSNDELERLRVIVAPLHKRPAPGKARTSLRKIKRILVRIAAAVEKKLETDKREDAA